MTPIASFKFSATKDVTAPALKSVTGLNDNQFVVEFTEKVDKATVEAADFSLVKASNFSAVSVTGVNQLAGDTTGTKYVVTTNLTTSDYATVNSIGLNIAIRDKAFKDVPGNESAATTSSVTLTKDAVAPTLSSTVFEKNNDGEVTKIVLKFDEEVVLPTGMDYSDLEVVQDNGVLQSGFFTSTKVDGKNVELTVKSGVKAGKFSISLPAGFVADKSINANKSTTTSSIVDFGKGETATTFTVTKAEVKKANEITVTFPTKVVGGAFDGSATSVDRYTLNGKSLPVGTKITLNSDQLVATIALPVGTISSTDNAAVFQIAGVKALTGETSKLFTETLTITDNVSPVLTGAQVLADGQTFVLTYNEALASVASNLGEEFKITVDGKIVTLTDADFTKVSATGKQIVAKVVGKVETAPEVKASATVTGADSAKVTVPNTVGPTVGGTFAVEAKMVEVTDAIDPTKTVDELHIFVDGKDVGKAKSTLGIDGVELTFKTPIATGDTFTLTTVKAKAATTSALTLDTSKAITVETVAPATNKENFDIEDADGNDQKAEVKLTTTR